MQTDEQFWGSEPSVLSPKKITVGKCDECDGEGYIFTTDAHGLPLTIECVCLESRRAQQRIARVLQQDGLPPEFGRYTFEHFSELPYAKLALNFSRQLGHGIIVDQIGVEKCGLLLSGPTGTGKTTLASVIAYTRVEAGQAIVWQDFNALVRKLRRTYQRHYDGPDVGEIVEVVSKSDFLLLDDLGSLTRASRDTELWAEDAIEAVREIANHRLNKQLPTVVTTNLSKEQLYTQFGDRVVSRLRGLCHAATMIGDDFRAPGDR